MSMQRLAKELASLKEEMAAMADERTSAAFSTSREKIDEAAKLLGGVIDEIEQFVSREEENIEDLIASRPLASVGAAFLAGIAIGFALRRAR